MDAELRFHLDSQISEYMRDGLSRAEAEQRARRDFGEVDLAKDECRDQRPLEWLNHLIRDFRHAGRTLLRNPGFAAAAVITIALGVGANAAIFNVVYAVLVRSLPYSQADEIHSVEVVIPERVGQFPSLPATVQAYLEWRKADTVFTDMTALRPWECNLTGDGEPERLGGAYVSTNFFSFLGVPIAHGRGFSATEEQPGNEKVVVISDGLWRRRYGSDPALIGRKIRINSDSYLVVGIASPSLLVPVGTLLHPVLPFAPRVDIWRPIAPTPRELAGESWDHGLLVRLPRGQSERRGREQLETILNSYIRAQNPGFTAQFKTRLVPIREVYAGNVRLRLLLILAASGLLLLTACVNIANLFLVRVVSRANEFATRLALGAGRVRILSHLLSETAVVALIGGTLGAIISGYGAALLASYGPDDVRLLTDTRLNLPVFLFALAASAVTAFACAAYPAWELSRRGTAMRESTRSTLGGHRTARSRQLLVAVQMALATVLLASSGLLLHSFDKVLNADRGYAIEHVLAVDLSLFGPRQDAAAFYRQLADNAQALPGVLAAGVINDLPAVTISSGASRTIFYSTDTDFRSVVLQRPVAMIRSITAGYFAASGTSIQAGRPFSVAEPAPVALISESLRKHLWPSETAAAILGRAIRQGNVTGPLITVVGVVRDVRPGTVDRDMPPLIYRPYAQWASGPATVVVRTAQDPITIAAALRAEIRKLDPNLPIPAIRTMREIVSNSVRQRRFQATLTSLFALLALMLGIVGVYGVVSYSVASRSRDIGLRIALGALRGDVTRWILVRGMQPVLFGLVAGLAAAIAIATVLRSLLFGVTPIDPPSIAVVVVVLLVTSGLACYIPAHRATRLDPVVALRQD